MTYKIDKSVPMPTTNNTGRLATYPLADMEIGDSFRMEFDHNKRSTVLILARRLHDRTFRTKAVIEDGEKFIRVWRVS